MSKRVNLNRFLNSSIVVIVITVILHFSGAFDNSKNDVISSEEIYCITAVCLVDPNLGSDCKEMKPVTAHVVVTSDMNVPGGKRIIIEPSNKSCGVYKGAN